MRFMNSRGPRRWLPKDDGPLSGQATPSLAIGAIAETFAIFQGPQRDRLSETLRSCRASLIRHLDRPRRISCPSSRLYYAVRKRP
jgi:hypothetical protein